MENTQTKVMTIWQGLADPHKWYTENGLISFKGIYEPYADEPKKKRELDLRN